MKWKLGDSTVWKLSPLRVGVTGRVAMWRLVRVLHMLEDSDARFDDEGVDGGALGFMRKLRGKRTSGDDTKEPEHGTTVGDRMARKREYYSCQTHRFYLKIKITTKTETSNSDQS